MTKQTTKQELLGEYAGDDYLTPDELDELGLEPTSENGTSCSTEEMRSEGYFYRLRQSDENATGYLVENVDHAPVGSILYYLERV